MRSIIDQGSTSQAASGRAGNTSFPRQGFYNQVATILGLPVGEPFDKHRLRGRELKRQGLLLQVLGELVVQHTITWQIGLLPGPFDEDELMNALPLIQRYVPDATFDEVWDLLCSDEGR